MSNKCLSFLLESFLYTNEYVESQYSTYQDRELIAELQRYREYVLSGIDEIKAEIRNTHDKLNVCIESFNTMPSEDVYKQLVLYMDQVIIPDPLFELTEGKSSLTNIMGKYIGLKQDDSFDREKLIDTITYIKYISQLILSGFVVMLPISLMHEAPKNVGIKYSPTAFSDVIPEPILKYYQSIARVYNLEKCSDGLKMDPNKPLYPGTQIYVDFPDEVKTKGSLFQYILQEIISLDEKTGRAKFRMYIPDSIDRSTFEYWVYQSINQSANNHFHEKYSELVLAQKCGCMYLSRSSLTAHILQMAIDKPSKDAELSNMALQLDLPVINQISLNDILEIRNNYGQAFHNFRNELNAKLIGLDTIENADALKRQLDTISYELNSVQVKEVEKEYRKISRTLKFDAIAFTGSLIASFATGGITAVGAAGAFVKGISDIGKYYTDVNEHNGLFLWKLNKQAKKYTT